MSERHWIKESIFLFTLPVTATTLAFAYEAGYASYFGIPLDLITLNWTAAALAFVALIFVFQLSASWSYILAAYIVRWKPWVTVKTALAVLPFVTLSLVLVFQYGLYSVFFWIVIALIAVYILSDLVLRIVLSLPRSGLWHRFREGSVRREHADPFSDPLNRFLFVVICVGVSLLIAWSTGYSTARDQRRFLVTHSPQERIVLRRYGDMFVIVDLDRSKKTVNQNFTFQAMTGDPARVFTPSDVGPINVQRAP